MLESAEFVQKLARAASELNQWLSDFHSEFYIFLGGSQPPHYGFLSRAE